MSIGILSFSSNYHVFLCIFCGVYTIILQTQFHVIPDCSAMHRRRNSEIFVTEFGIIMDQAILACQNQALFSSFSGGYDQIFHKLCRNSLSAVFLKDIQAENTLIASVRIMKRTVLKHFITDRAFIGDAAVDETDNPSVMDRYKERVRKCFDSLFELKK